MAIRGDSTEYNLLKEWCETLPFFEEPKSVTTCEIGIREGLGSKIIIAGIKKRIGFIPYKHIAIDPYGNLKYQHYDKGPAYTADYTDSMRLQMEEDFKEEENFKFHHMTDIEFMNTHINSGPYDLVHFDGPHMTKDVLRESIWFADRSRKGTRFIFDDYTKFEMDQIAFVLTHFGFKTLKAGENKICLQKI
jgi:hypothetical protein